MREALGQRIVDDWARRLAVRESLAANEKPSLLPMLGEHSPEHTESEMLLFVE